MTLVGMLFNPMNLLAYKVKHIYASVTLFYSGLTMAANMIWAHEIIHYLQHRTLNFQTLIIGIALVSVALLRN